MQPHKSSVADLFSVRKQYTLPLFQRRYVWTREKQWEPLWQDLITRTESLLDRERPNGNSRSHFFGAIVTVPFRPIGLNVPHAEVIDGQQRLTTLQLLIVSLADVFRDRALGDLSSAFAGLGRNSTPLGAEEQVYKVWPTNQDRSVFQDVMDSQGVAELTRRHPEVRRKYQRAPDPRPRIVEAYLFFEAVIREWLAAGPQTERERATALYTALTSQFHVVHIELDPDEDPQDIFEALNGRNEPLLPSDLIKNHLFRQAGARAEALHTTFWKPLDDRRVDGRIDPVARGADDGFWAQAQRQGRFNRSRLDLFLFHYTTMQTMREVMIGELFRAFQAWWGSAPRDLEQELRELSRHANLFAELLVPSGSNRRALFAKRLRVLDTTSLYPLVLFLLGRGAPRVQDLDGILADLESYLVRRMICGLTNKNYNQFFLSMLRRVDALPVIDRHTFQTALHASHEESARWPGDTEFRRAWLERPAYTDLRASRTRMVLEALEDALRPLHAVEVRIESALTVEHVMPQKWQTHWAPPIGDHGAATRDRLLHTFGNLTLLTGPLNSSLQNASFAIRRPEIAKAALLNLNVPFQNPHLEWNEGTILERGEQLFAAARLVWPAPPGEP